MKKKTTTSTLLLRYLWSQMQEGRRHFGIADTNLAFSATAQQLSKAVRRFNESGHQLRFPGWRFHARVVDRNLYAANLSFQRGDKAYPF